MVIVIQLLLFLGAAIFRGYYLFGKHLSDAGGNRLDYVSRHKGRVQSRHVGIKCQSGIPFVIKSERWYHRFLKNVGMASEISVKSAEFDQKYFIATDFPYHLEHAVHSRGLLEQLQKLFALPVKALYATSDRLWCVIEEDDDEKPDEYFATHRAILEAIAKSTTKASEGYDYIGASKPSKITGPLALLFISLHAGLLMVGAFGIVPTFFDSLDIVDTMQWVLFAGSIGAAIGGLWFLLIVSVFNNTSWVCWVFADFLLCGVAGILLASVFITREANLHLPQPASEVHSVAVLQKACILKCRKSCGRRCTRRSSYTYYDDACTPKARPGIRERHIETDSICRNGSARFEYHLSLQHWSKPTNYSFETDAGLFDKVRIGSQVAVPVNKGALRLEWVDMDKIEALSGYPRRGN